MAAPQKSSNQEQGDDLHDAGIEILPAPPPPAFEAAARFISRDGTASHRDRMLAAEVPVSIAYNGIAHAVMMASPVNIDDFVTGFTLTERIVEHAREIVSITVRPLSLGLLAQVELTENRAKTLLNNRRNLVGQTGCGLCGIVELEHAIRRFAPNHTRPSISTKGLFAALDGLAAQQTLNEQTGAVHAAGFADDQGRLRAVREDVGRHNALDKLIGHLAQAGVDPSSGFALVTSRLSFELVQKCLAVGIPALAGISAPTSLAVQLAQNHQLTLVALARRDGFQVFSDPFGIWA